MQCTKIVQFLTLDATFDLIDMSWGYISLQVSLVKAIQKEETCDYDYRWAVKKRLTTIRREEIPGAEVSS